MKAITKKSDRQNHFIQQCVKFYYTKQWQKAAQQNVYRCENQCNSSPSPVW